MMNNNENKLFSVMCYDMYGHCDRFDIADFDKALNKAIEEFKNVNYQIVRVVSPYQDNDLIYFSKVGY